MEKIYATLLVFLGQKTRKALIRVLGSCYFNNFLVKFSAGDVSITIESTVPGRVVRLSPCLLHPSFFVSCSVASRPDPERLLFWELLREMGRCLQRV